MAIVNFPSDPNNNDIFTGGGKTFVYNSTKSAWQKSITEFFYLVQLNTFTGPVTGNVGFTPIKTIQLMSIQVSLAINTSTTIVFQIRKNNESLQEFTIDSDQLSLTAGVNTNSITTDDSVFLDIISGSGTDLVMKFNYV
jgi:carbamoylphosphate synthase small subunit